MGGDHIFQSQCDSMAVFLLLLPGTRYTHLHGSHIDKGDRRARLNKHRHQIHQDRERNPLPLQLADLLRLSQPEPPADNSDNVGPSAGKLTPGTYIKRKVRTESAQGLFRKSAIIFAKSVLPQERTFLRTAA
jgi:hypothetical protein